MKGAVLLRLALLALGMGLIEIGLTDALGQGSVAGWGLVFLGGFPLVLAGTADVIGPLVRARAGTGKTETMGKRTLAGALAATLLLAVLAPPVLAHGVVSVTVDPMTATAGEDVTISVAGVEPDQDRVIVLIGQGIVVPYPTVRTDASGSFTAKLTIPSRLPGGTYRFEAIGDETLTGEVDVIAAAGGIAAQAPAEQALPESRSRGAPETAAIAALAVLAGLIGLALVLRAERFRSTAGA